MGQIEKHGRGGKRVEGEVGRKQEGVRKGEKETKRRTNSSFLFKLLICNILPGKKKLVCL